MTVEAMGGGIIHRIATCNVCDWSSGCMNHAIAHARAHTEKTGHETNVETGNFKIYRKVESK